jgi:hypothetical protein
MIKLGLMRRLACTVALRGRAKAEATARFVQKFEIAVFDGDSKVVLSRRPALIFYYPSKRLANKMWAELVSACETDGVFGRAMQIIRSGKSR